MRVSYNGYYLSFPNWWCGFDSRYPLQGILNRRYMDHKKASAVLIKLLDKKVLDAEEKEAVSIAIGVLAWTALSQGRIKAMRAKREKLKGSKVQRS